MRTAGAAPGSGTGSLHKKSYELKIDSADWVDTGISLAAGEEANFTATGEVELVDGRTTGPDGLARGFRDVLRQFPLNSAPVGALIGRVSDVDASVPFLVGASGQVTMPTRGRLYLRVNLPTDLTGTGGYKVKLKFANPAKPPATPAAASGIGSLPSSAVSYGHRVAAPPAAGVSALLSPETFADIPRRVEDKQGDAGDMVNFALLGTQAQVEAAFKQAGWASVDKNVEDAVLHGLLATLGHEAYTEMPMSTLYLFGRPQDLSFARGDPLKVAAERHHLRVWRTDKTVGGMPFWVGSATHDIGFETDQRNGGVTHRIDPKVDGERDFILHSFDAAGVFSSAAYVIPADPLTSARTATGGSFSSDGRIVVMELK